MRSYRTLAFEMSIPLPKAFFTALLLSGSCILSHASGAVVKAWVCYVDQYATQEPTGIRSDPRNAKFREAAKSFETYLGGVVGSANVELKANPKSGDLLKRVSDEMRDFGSEFPPLFIFYFCGHGYRLETHGATESVLRLKTGLDVDSSDRDLHCQELINLLTTTRRDANFMVFFDCCFSGGGLLFHSRVGTASYQERRLDDRGFVMAGTSGNEVAEAGIFTDALISTWKDLESKREFHKCTVYEILAQIRQFIRNDRKSFLGQVPTLILGNDRLSYGLLSSKSSIVLVDVGVWNPVHYTVYNEKEIIFSPPGNPPRFFFVSLPRKLNNLVIETGGQDRTVDVDLSGRPFDFVEMSPPIDTLISSTVTREKINEIAQNELVQLIETAEENGIPSSLFSWEAARIAADSDPFVDRDMLLAEIAKIEGPSKSTVNLAVSAFLNGDEFEINSNGLELARALEESGVGGFGTVGNFRLNCLEYISSDSDSARESLGLDRSPSDYFVQFAKSANKAAVLSRDPSLLNRSKQTFEMIESRNQDSTILSAKDLKTFGIVTKNAASIGKTLPSVESSYKLKSSEWLRLSSKYKSTNNAIDRATIFRNMEILTPRGNLQKSVQRDLQEIETTAESLRWTVSDSE